MIAVSSKGRSFGALATYLAAGRTGQERDRVAWSTARNLPTNDPELAGKIMRATAERSTRVEQPVYHLVLSFDPNDGPDRATMERVADRVLERIQLHEHQAVIVAHRDREHSHVHILVNRVHPKTGLAWEYSFDYRAIQEVLREEERALGIRQVTGRYRERGMEVGADIEGTAEVTVTQGHGAPSEVGEGGLLQGSARAVFDVNTAPIRREESALNPEVERRAQRADPAFIDYVRARLPELRAADSWGEFEAALASNGLRLEPRGQGFIVTDGEHAAKASTASRDLSRSRLEARFGEAWPSYSAGRMAAIEKELTNGNDDPIEARPRGAEESLREVNRVGMLRVQLESYERATALYAEHYTAVRDLTAVRARASQLDVSEVRVRLATDAFERELGAVYGDPQEARRAFERFAGERGIASAVEGMRRHPEQFGRLLIVQESRAFGLVRNDSDMPAREAALSAALHGKEAWDAHLAMPDAGEPREIRGAGSMASERERMARDATRRGPDKSKLEREIGYVLRRLLPREIEDLRRAVTRPQFAIAMKMREAAREALLGREVSER